MATTSIHIEPCKGGSERHNLRESELDYVRKDLSHLNESLVTQSISECLADIKTRYEKTVGQKMQSKATPIREGVVVIEQSTTMAQLKKFADELEDRYGIKTLQIHTHKDEGHKNSAEWKPNLHAHMVFNWTAEDGRSLKLGKQDMIDIQTLLADSLGMQRGVSSDVKHLNAIQFKIEKETERLNQLLQDKQKEIDLLQPKPLGAVMGFLTSPLSQQATENKQLKSELEATREHIEHIQNATQIQIQQINKEAKKAVDVIQKDIDKLSKWFPIAEMKAIETELKVIKLPQTHIDTLIRDKETTYTGALFSPGHNQVLEVTNINFEIKNNKLTALGLKVEKMFDFVLQLFQTKEAQRLEAQRKAEEKAEAQRQVQAQKEAQEQAKQREILQAQAWKELPIEAKDAYFIMTKEQRLSLFPDINPNIPNPYDQEANRSKKEHVVEKNRDVNLGL